MIAQERPSNITNVRPSFAKKPVKDVYAWLEAKRNDDGVEGGLWRIHNKLYDLTDFVKKHPGGADWIRLTQGLDITEAVETHHIYPEKLTALMAKYQVRETSKPRNCKLTFKEDGFYVTLRKRVALKLSTMDTTKPKLMSKIYIDVLFALTLATSILAQRYQSLSIALVCGLLYTWTGICGHNFLHQRDNHRMKYFNLLLMSYHDWRISHALSHHLFPNSMLDIEIIMFEPIFVWTPCEKSKNWFQRYGSYAYAPIYYCLTYPLEFIKKSILAITKKNTFYLDDFLPFFIPIMMFLFGGTNSIVSALKLFSFIILSSGLFFGIIAINGGHHHPELVHEGDAIRDGFDWGIYSIDTVMDRQELRGGKLLALANFGDHALHHLFPTLDSGVLPHLYDVFFQTLIEFEAECKCYSWIECIKGQFQQLSRTETIKLSSHEQYVNKYIKKG